MITFGVEQLDNYQRNAYGTTKWAANYAGRNPVAWDADLLEADADIDDDLKVAVWGSRRTILTSKATLPAATNRSTNQSSPP